LVLLTLGPMRVSKTLKSSLRYMLSEYIDRYLLQNF